MPELLAALWSPVQAVRFDAYGALLGALCPEGNQAEAAEAAVPVVIDMVADPQAPDRSMACQLLGALAIGDQDKWLGDPSRLDRLRREVARKATMTVEELNRERAEWIAAAPTEAESLRREWDAWPMDAEDIRRAELWELRAYDAVRRGVPVFIEALWADTDDPELQLMAAHLLGWFPEESSVSGPHLVRLLAREPDTALAANASIAAGLLGVPDSELVANLHRRLDGSYAAGRWAAAIALAYLSPSPGTEAVRQLYECVHHGAEGPLQVPYYRGDMSRLSAIALTRLAPDAAPERLDVLLTRLADLHPGPAALVCGRSCLKIAFPDGPLAAGAHSAELSEGQRKVIAVLDAASASAGTFWWKELAVHYGLRDFMDGNG